MWSRFSVLLLCFLAVMMQNCSKAQLKLVENGKSTYVIVIGQKANAQEQKAATVLQKYLKQISGAILPIKNDASAEIQTEIIIGKTSRTDLQADLVADGFEIKSSKAKLVIAGNDKGTLYGVYHFLENYLNCRKFTQELTVVPKQSSIVLNSINDVQNPQFQFRQVYYPGQYDEEYRDWHKLDLLENEFGLWGHTFDKLVPAKTYFKSHPEYFALVNGKRNYSQLCLSNPQVFQILTANLKKQIGEEPEKKIWSVSQNDGFGYCTCDQCKATDAKFGGPQGSVVNFVNKVAAKFPNYTISTLAYLYTQHPPKNLKPAKNVSVLFSTINANRAESFATDKRSNGLRNDLIGWTALTPNVMVWDYVVQFTNYLSPFPNISTLSPNMAYLADAKTNGVFVQGTEATKGEFSELKAYLLAKLSWNPKTDTAKDIDEFLKAYYGKAAPQMKLLQDEMFAAVKQSKRILDIYGEPAVEWNKWLKPEYIVKFDDLLSDAERAVEGTQYAPHVLKERLALEYAVLQQAQLYGLKQHGIFETTDGKTWKLRPGYDKRITNFVTQAEKLGVTQLNEIGVTPAQYKTKWDKILKDGPILSESYQKEIKANIVNDPEYSPFGIAALTDGSRGYENFQYGYVGWNGTDLDVTVDMGRSTSIQKVAIGVLEDQRHWAFLPTKVEVLVSDDGNQFKSVVTKQLPATEEVYDVLTHRFSLPLPSGIKAQYVRVKATNLKEVPEWRAFPGKKSWLFCDEVSIN